MINRYHNILDNDDHSNNLIELYSIQSTVQLDSLDKNGFITGDKKYILSGDSDWDNMFVYAYRWLINKMVYRYNLIVPDNVKNIKKTDLYPIWFWYSYDGQSKRKPCREDILDMYEHPYNDNKQVLITFNKKSSDILLSDFNLWHHVLNKWIIGHNDYYTLIEEYLDKNYKDINFNKLPVKYQKIIKESWNIIFDMSYSDPDLTDEFKNKCIQGTTWSINQSDIIDIEYI